MQFDLLLTVDWDYYRKFMAVNMDGALLCTRACYKHMAARGGGAIVNQSSTAAWLYSGFYGLAKVGVNGLTQQLAHELGGASIRVNAIAPGPTDTEATRKQAGEGMVDELVKDLAIKRTGTPTTWSAPACSCCPTRPAGSPARSSTSTAGRCSGERRSGSSASATSVAPMATRLAGVARRPHRVRRGPGRHRAVRGEGRPRGRRRRPRWPSGPTSSRSWCATTPR